MTIILGAVNVPVPGTPVRLMSALPSELNGFTIPPANWSCHAVLAQARYTNTGRVFVGKSGLVGATGVNCLWTGAIPTANSIPSLSVACTIEPAGVTFSDLYLDAEIAGEGILLSLEVA